jgi:hypothetical protein
MAAPTRKTPASPPNQIKRTVSSMKVTHNSEGAYVVEIVWAFQLQHDGKPGFGEGWKIHEDVYDHDGVDYIRRDPHKGDYVTNGVGAVTDLWRMFFTSLNGRVTAEQTLTASGYGNTLSGSWRIIVAPGNGGYFPAGTSDDTMSLH